MTTVSICERRHKVAGMRGNERHIDGWLDADLTGITVEVARSRPGGAELSTGVRVVHRRPAPVLVHPAAAGSAVGQPTVKATDGQPVAPSGIVSAVSAVWT